MGAQLSQVGEFGLASGLVEAGVSGYRNIAD